MIKTVKKREYLTEAMCFNLLHEHAAKQYRLLWCKVNERITTAVTGKMDSEKNRYALSCAAYAICQMIEPKQPHFKAEIEHLLRLDWQDLRYDDEKTAYGRGQHAARKALLLFPALWRESE